MRLALPVPFLRLGLVLPLLLPSGASLQDQTQVEAWIREGDQRIRAGQFDEARQILKAACKNRGYTPGDAIAHVHVVLREHEDAMRELQRAYNEHSSSLHFIGIAPEFAPLRADKRFISIVERIGLQPEKVFANTGA